MFLGETQTMCFRDLSHAGAWGQCATVHSGNKLKQVCATIVHEKIVHAVGVLSTLLARIAKCELILALFLFFSGWVKSVFHGNPKSLFHAFHTYTTLDWFRHRNTASSMSTLS